MVIHNFVLKEAVFLNLQEIKSLYGYADEKSLQEVKKKKVEMDSMLFYLKCLTELVINFRLIFR